MKFFKNRLALIGVAIVAVTALQPAYAVTVVDSINEDAVALNNASWAINNIGWFYTPSFNYELIGLATRFSVADGRTVGAAFYSGAPGSLNLLGSGNLTATTGFSQALFANPVRLTNGTRYFFAFSNVNRLGVNLSNDFGAENLGNLRGDGGPAPGIFDFQGPEFHFSAQPIVQFLGASSAVPEPAAWVMLIFGLAGIGGALRIARHKQKAVVALT